MPTLVKYNKRAVRWVRIKIKEDGKSLPAEKIEKERKNATDRLIEAEEKAAKLASATPVPDEDFVPDATGAYFNLSIARLFRKSIEVRVGTILEAFDFSYVRQETLNARPTFVLNFKPKPNMNFPDSVDYYANLTGTVWIDAADRIAVKVEGWPLNAERKVHPAIYYEAAQAPGNKWLPRLIRLNGREYKTFLGGLDIEVEALLTDYQRFDAEVKDVKIITPK